MIPRVIHQLWIGPHPRPDAWMATWPRLNPRWRYVLWDDARCAAFGFRNARQIAAIGAWSGKCDLMRYEILARHGGLFFDADEECLRPLGDELLAPEAWACWENEIVRPGLLGCGALGSVPGSALMERCVAACARRDVTAGPAWKTVGPQLLTDVARDDPSLHVYPSWLFYPVHHTGFRMAPGGEPYGTQRWGSTHRLYNRPAGRVLPWHPDDDGLALGAAALAGAGLWWWARGRR